MLHTTTCRPICLTCCLHKTNIVPHCTPDLTDGTRLQQEETVVVAQAAAAVGSGLLSHAAVSSAAGLAAEP